MSIISISGPISSGKNTVASIIQYLLWKQKVESGDNTVSPQIPLEHFITSGKYMHIHVSGWKQVAFAGKLKQIASILTGVSVENFEDQEFKKQEMPEQWRRFYFSHYKASTNKNPDGRLSKFYSSKEEAEQDYAVKAMFSRTDLKSEIPTWRTYLQELGTEALRSVHPDIHVNGLFADYSGSIRCNKCDWTGEESDLIRGQDEEGAFDGCPKCKTDEHLQDVNESKWLVTDTRFANEFQAVKQRDGLCIRIIRPGVEQGTHASERGLDSVSTHEWDYTLINDNSIEVLVQRVETMLKYLKIIK